MCVCVCVCVFVFNFKAQIFVPIQDQYKYSLTYMENWYDKLDEFRKILGWSVHPTSYYKWLSSSMYDPEM